MKCKLTETSQDKEKWSHEMGMTLAEKVWRDHVVKKGENGAPDLLYIDLQL